MAADLQQLVSTHQTNGGYIPPLITSLEAPESSAAVSIGVSSGSKRLRRPSVRLGEIGGDQQHVAYDSHSQRPKWRPIINRKDLNQSGKSSSRARTVTNLSSGYENTDEDPISVGTWRVNKWVKSSDANTTTEKRSRLNQKDGVDQEDEYFIEEEEEEGFIDFSREDSESPMKDVFESRDWDNGGRGRGRRGVKMWLQELGLGRYWPMYEMHEVDEQVLPFLTLEDLKDMGINAVGSRRKMFSALQKLGTEFS
ncbi:unnamed protein product [Cochlearia groenlandica]